MLIVDDFIIPPILHLFMPKDNCLKVISDKVFLVLHVHVINDVFYIKRRANKA